MPKISGLPSATTVSPSDFIVLVDNAAVPETKKATANLLSALAPVQTVSGRIGAVVLSSNDVGLGNVNNTSDANKPVSTAQQAALDLKAPIANPTFTGTVGGVTKSMVGLGNVDDTSDVNKPVSTAQSTADTAVQNYAVQRANHTGTQNSATIADFALEAAKYGPVTSVAGKTGTVLLAAGDVTGLAAVATSGSASDLSTGTLASARLPLATTSTLGAVSVGTGLSVTAGAVSANVQSVAGKTGAVTLALTDVSGADNIVFSKISGITGATAITNIVTLSQAQYDALLTPDSTTLYVIKDAAAAGPGAGGDGTDSVLRALFLPPAPTSVTASAGNAQVVVSWTAPTGVISQAPITDYVVQFSSNSGSTWTTFADGTSTAASATVTGLSNGTAYVFRVAGVNGVGTGSYSTASSAVTPAAITPDPYFSNVSLLLHMDGTGSTFVDSSPTPRTITAYGATQSSAESRWGGKSAYFDGSGNHFRFVSDWLNEGIGVTLGANPFVLEMWFKTSTTTQYAQLIGNERNGGTTGFTLLINDSYAGQIAVYGLNGSLALSSTSYGYNDNQWHHLALVRDGNTFSFYIDGTRSGQTTAYVNLGSENSFYVGKNGEFSARNFAGYIDDLRITVNSIRGYTGATITVPTAAFPDFGPNE